MILLDTNAVIWMLAGDRRAAPLLKSGARLFLSPVSLLEIKFLVEVGRLREPPDGIFSLAEDPRWDLDSPSTEVLLRSALDVDWTRDPSPDRPCPLPPSPLRNRGPVPAGKASGSSPALAEF